MTNVYLSFCVIALFATNQTYGKDKKCDFLWGTASSSYQVEGGWNAEGKGPSNWDYFTHNNVTKYTIGKSENGDIATNQISREVYLKDIKLMKELGVNSYRFSISWSRVMPDGEVLNPQGIAYYAKLIADLKENGIKPIVTLYHWDMPLALYNRGGWANPDSPFWFDKYAQIIFKKFGDTVPVFITFNEPEGYVFTLEPLADNLVKNKVHPYESVLSVKSRSRQAISLHNVLLANALAVKSFRRSNHAGKIGLALNLSPCIDPKNKNSKAADICNDLHNHWILDALFKGKYPQSIQKMYQNAEPSFVVNNKDMLLIKASKPDFIGVNYYGPTLVKDDNDQPFGVGNRPNPDIKPAYNGPVSPNDMVDMLKKFDQRYGKQSYILTENGAGFGNKDEVRNGAVIEDSLRAEYLEKHIHAVMQARQNNINIVGYLYWSLLDNFEWLWGYDNKFGLISVDFNDRNLTRMPKLSYYRYQTLIKNYSQINSCKANK
ncbi:glycoside hydrolase family 1 protein [Vagococcus sp. WN89Y]|uniref:glycoside hydrolase family 1 protein n=1 Tax=Vagococcus sp. WN89Y TaxID=3457258 RepID=UPI003FCDF679